MWIYPTDEFELKMAAWWRAAGLNYLRVSQVAASATRRALRPELQKAAADRALKSVVIKKH